MILTSCTNKSFDKLALDKLKTRIPRNVASRLSALCHKTELNAKTRQKFTPPTTSEKQRICLASVSHRRDKNLVGFNTLLCLAPATRPFFQLFLCSKVLENAPLMSSASRPGTSQGISAY